MRRTITPAAFVANWQKNHRMGRRRYALVQAAGVGGMFSVILGTWFYLNHPEDFVILPHLALWFPITAAYGFLIAFMIWPLNEKIYQRHQATLAGEPPPTSSSSSSPWAVWTLVGIVVVAAAAGLLAPPMIRQARQAELAKEEPPFDTMLLPLRSTRVATTRVSAPHDTDAGEEEYIQLHITDREGKVSTFQFPKDAGPDGRIHPQVLHDWVPMKNPGRARGICLRLMKQKSSDTTPEYHTLAGTRPPRYKFPRLF